MELMDAIRARRSIRMFTSRPVERERIEALIDAATYAPSRFNTQPWHFHIATGEARKRVAEVTAMSTAYVQEYLAMMGPEVIEHAARFYADLGGAPVVIGVSGPLPADENDAISDVIAVGAALQNFLLSVAEHGLAACSITAPHWVRDELVEAFEIPEGSRLLAMIVLGYGDEIPHAKDRHKNVATFLT